MWRAAVWLTCVALPALAWAQSAAPNLAPRGLEAAMLAAPQKTPLLEAAIIAGGTPDTEVAALASKLRAVLDQVRTRARTQPTALERGRALLTGLHQTLLRRYQSGASTLDMVWRTGEFNCLSSAVLFVVAADGLLDHPRAMLSMVHAFARVDVDGRSVDVEATHPAGFDPDRKRLFTPAFSAQLGLFDAQGRPANVGRQAQIALELPAVALVAGVYSNRAAQMLRRGDTHGAAIAMDRAARLGSGPQKQRLVEWRGALLSNAVKELVDAGRLEEALPLAQAAVQAQGAAPWQRAARHNLAALLCKLSDAAWERGEVEDALKTAERAQAVQPGLEAAMGRVARARTRLAQQQGNAGLCVDNTDTRPAARAECLATVSSGLLKAGKLAAALQTAQLALQVLPASHNAQVAAYNAWQLRGEQRAKQGRCRAAAQDWREAAALQVGKGQAVEPAAAEAQCFMALGYAASTQGRLDAAVEAYQQAYRLAPEDPQVASGMATAAINAAVTPVNRGNCDQARVWLAQAVDAEPQQRPQVHALLATCAQFRVKAAFDRKQWAQAAAEARRGQMDAPHSAALRQALAAALFNAARQQALAGNCTQAKILAAEAAAAGADVKALAARCP